MSQDGLTYVLLHRLPRLTGVNDLEPLGSALREKPGQGTAAGQSAQPLSQGEVDLVPVLPLRLGHRTGLGGENEFVHTRDGQRGARAQIQVVPGQTLFLLAQEVSFRPRRFVSRTQGIVDGKLVFECTITGMAL